MYLVYDTETTGFPDFKKSLDDKTNARVIQLGAILYDEKFQEVCSYSTLVKPDNWTISSGAFGAHGISQEKCEEYGAPISLVLSVFEHMLEAADFVIAHNQKFDNRLMSCELAISGRSLFGIPLEKCFCTMEATTPLCKLPSKIPGKYKWPKLAEVYAILFKEELKGAHDALVDCRATARVFKHLVEQKLIQLPRIV